MNKRCFILFFRKILRFSRLPIRQIHRIVGQFESCSIRPTIRIIICKIRRGPLFILLLHLLTPLLLLLWMMILSLLLSLLLLLPLQQSLLLLPTSQLLQLLPFPLLPNNPLPLYIPNLTSTLLFLLMLSLFFRATCSTIFGSIFACP